MCIRDSSPLGQPYLHFLLEVLAGNAVEHLFHGDMVVVPVSYTHLDVYKRQQGGSPICGSETEITLLHFVVFEEKIGPKVKFLTHKQT